MIPRHFIMTITATIVLFHLLRFPHLILENGGGAFMLLFLIVLNGAIFPLLITERILDNKLKSIDLRSLIWIKKGGKSSLWDRPLIFIWYILRLVVLLFFLWFFLYLSGTSILYFLFFFKYLFAPEQVSDLSSMPQLNLGFLGGLLWSVGVFFVYLKSKKKFFPLFNQWILPGCFLILLFLFFKIILSLQNFEALKVLFYPDFLSLKPSSYLDAIGHGLGCLFIGVGLYRYLIIDESKLDSISVFIHLVITTLVLALITGVMALPLIHQVSDLPFGSSWVFSVLPRWLSYTEYGLYYCALFYAGIGVLSFYFSVLLIDLISGSSKMIYAAPKKSLQLNFTNFIFVLTNGLMVYILQNNLQGWSGQSLLLKLDFLLINIGLPSLAVMTIWFVFRYTSQGERSQVFSYQQIFFHSRYFFKAWSLVTLYTIPPFILFSFLLYYYFK